MAPPTSSFSKQNGIFQFLFSYSTWRRAPCQPFEVAGEDASLLRESQAIRFHQHFGHRIEREQAGFAGVKAGEIDADRVCEKGKLQYAELRSEIAVIQQEGNEQPINRHVQQRFFPGFPSGPLGWIFAIAQEAPG